MAVFGRNALVRRTRSGDFDIRIRSEERELLASLVGQLRGLLTAGAGGGAAQTAVDPSLTRLFPTAYPDDVTLDSDYQALVRDDLLERRLTTLDVVETTLGADRVSEEHLVAWMAAVNDLRLVLGTRLDVSEAMAPPDLDDPEAPVFAVYEYLGWLLEHIVAALADALPDLPPE